MPPGLLWGGEKQSQESTAEFQLRGRWMGYNPHPHPHPTHTLPEPQGSSLGPSWPPTKLGFPTLPLNPAPSSKDFAPLCLYFIWAFEKGQREGGKVSGKWNLQLRPEGLGSGDACSV